jgi:hypothetical protein
LSNGLFDTAAEIGPAAVEQPPAEGEVPPIDLEVGIIDLLGRYVIVVLEGDGLRRRAGGEGNDGGEVGASTEEIELYPGEDSEECKGIY